MSTILDALRKLQRERTAAHPSRDLRGSITDEIPLPRSPRRSSRRGVALAGIVLLLAAAGAGAWLVRSGKLARHSQPQVEAGAAADAPAREEEREPDEREAPGWPWAPWRRRRRRQTPRRARRPARAEPPAGGRGRGGRPAPAADDPAAAAVTLSPPVRVESIRWHPISERRVATLRFEQQNVTDAHEGDLVGGVLVYRIDPGAVEIRVGSTSRVVRPVP